MNEIESCGAQFRLNGKLRDPYELFAESGADLVRLRLWNNPTWTKFSTEADVTRSIERAHKAGMFVLLDFHYSDDWADPQKQTIPAAWAADIGDADKLATHVYEYTRDVLARLNPRGLLPYMVQVGNETTRQCCGRPKPRACPSTGHETRRSSTPAFAPCAKRKRRMARRRK